MQMPISDLPLPCADQRHKPVTLLSGDFRDVELRWSTIKKQTLAIMTTVEGIH